MGLPIGWVSDDQRAVIRRRLAPLRRRSATITRIVGTGSANKAPRVMAEHVAYRRGIVAPGSLRPEPGVLEVLSVLMVQFAADVDLQAHDTVTDEDDGLIMQITAVILDVHRRGSLIALAQVNA